MDAAPRLLTDAECAKILNLPLAFLRRVARQGQIPFLRVGNAKRYNAEAVSLALYRLAAGTTGEPLPDSPTTAPLFPELEKAT